MIIFKKQKIWNKYTCEQEKNAIIAGQKKYGNSWSLIQKCYPILEDRDPVGIKVR